MSTPSTGEEAKPLPAVLDISAAADFYQNLQHWCGSSATVVLDASTIERITTPCIQILLSANNSLKKSGGGLKIIGASDAFLAACRDLGLEKPFEAMKG